MKRHKPKMFIEDPEIKEPVDMGIKFLESMQCLCVKDGDIIVFRYSGCLSQNTAKNLKESIRDIVGFDIKVMILEDNIEIGVLHPDKEQYKGETIE